MKTTNRIANRTTAYLLSFILTACSIPNIWANTNPENSPQHDIYAVDPIYDELSIYNDLATNNNETPIATVAPQETSTPAAEAIATQEVSRPTASAVTAPSTEELQRHLELLSTISDNLLAAIENGSLVVPEPKGFTQELNDIKQFTVKALKDIQQLVFNIKDQMLYEIIINLHLDRIIGRISGKNAVMSDPAQEVEAIDAKDQTLDDLNQAMLKTTQKFLQLNEVVTKKSKSGLGHIHDHAINQLCTIDMILEGLAQSINNQFIKVTDKRAVFDFIKQLRSVIEACKYNRGEVTEQSELMTLNLNAYLIEKITELIKNNFKIIPVVDIESLVKKSKREVAIEELETILQVNEKLLGSLEVNSNDAGLTWYNHVFRKINSVCDFNTLSRRTILTAAVLVGVAAGAHALGVMPQEIKNWSMPLSGGKLKIFGEPWRYDAYGHGIPPSPEDAGLVGNLINNASIAWANPIVKVASVTAIGYGTYDWENIKKWYNEKTTDLSNFLLGTKAAKNNKKISNNEPKYTFNDVIGQEETKDDFKDIIAYFKNPKSFDNTGLSNGLSKGIIFTGSARSGKSFFAEALAGEINEIFKAKGETFNYLVVPNDLLRTAGGITMVMEYAKTKAPCLLFIDEIHLLGLQMGKNDAILSEFLTELGGWPNDPSKKVFVIAATNKPELLDQALRSSGRLGKEIYFEYPTYENRKTFIIDLLEKSLVNIDLIDIVKLARESEGCTFEKIKETMLEAFMRARHDLKAISQEYLDISYDKNIRGIKIHDDYQLPQKERALLAAHLSGAALATRLLAPQKSIAKVTTLRVNEAAKERSLMEQYGAENGPKAERIVKGKLFTYTLNYNQPISTIQDEINACMISLAGHAAGNILFGKAKNITKKGQEAFDIALKIVCDGINIEKFDDSLKSKYYARALALRNACEAKVTALLEQNKNALGQLAQILFEVESLTGDQIDYIISECKPSFPDRNDDTFINGIIDDNAAIA